MSAVAYIKSSHDMSEVPDESVQLVVTTPPENIICRPIMEGILSEVRRVLKLGGFFVFNVGVPIKSCFGFSNSLHPYLCACKILGLTGFTFVWHMIGCFLPKGVGIYPPEYIPNKRPYSCFENWLIFAKSDAYELRLITGDVMEYPVPRQETNEEALEWILQITTDEGDTVLDCFAGSGTAAKVALKMKRNAILYEIESDLIEKILKKIPDIKIVKP